jgi:hypothetical protein
MRPNAGNDGAIKFFITIVGQLEYCFSITGRVKKTCTSNMVRASAHGELSVGRFGCSGLWNYHNVGLKPLQMMQKHSEAG